MPYLDKAEALVRSRERAANAGPEAEAFMNEFLDLSARKDISGNIHFAPFLTAAVWLEQSPQFQMLKKAEDGVEFDQMRVAIASLRALQAAYDAANMLMIPAGMEAVARVESKKLPLFSTQILRTKVSP
ncbi:hypothetical protein [Chroococcidiopsis sp.]|uniref:hypothetical protein n=1 Tax=Chroococcidiopsis sp. TaxID=3088168 RepID=UPI003F2E9EF0